MEEEAAPFVASQHFVEALEGPAMVSIVKAFPPPLVAFSLCAGKSQTTGRRLG